MSELIVLGLIPGTHLQISFVLWLLLVVGLLTTHFVRVARRLHLMRNWIISLRMVLLTRRKIGRPYMY